MQSKSKIIEQLRDTVKNKYPIDYFSKLTDLLEVMSNDIDALKHSDKKSQMVKSLMICWDPHIASQFVMHQILELKKDKEMYQSEIEKLEEVIKNTESIYKEFSSYAEFVKFWRNTLGWHPFIE